MSNRALFSYPALLVASLMLVGCGQDSGKNSATPPIPKAEALPSGAVAPGPGEGKVLEAPTTKSFEGITLIIPAGWEERPLASEFVQGEYRVNGAAGTARMTLSSAGGGLEANLERWQGQFHPDADDPPTQRTTVPVGNVEAVIIELHGTFNDSFGGGGPQKDWAMLGAVIPTGPANFFLKLTGPRETVMGQQERFRELVKSAKLSG